LGGKNKGKDYLKNMGVVGMMLNVIVKRDDEGLWTRLDSVTQERTSDDKL